MDITGHCGHLNEWESDHCRMTDDNCHYYSSVTVINFYVADEAKCQAHDVYHNNINDAFFPEVLLILSYIPDWPLRDCSDS